MSKEFILHLGESSRERESLEALWERQDEAYDRLLLLRHEKPEDVFGKTWERAFRVRPRTVTCIDERVSLGNPDDPELALAGTGVFLDERGFDTLVAYCAQHGVDRITYHEGCGACHLFCARALKRTGISLEPEVIAREQAEKLHTALELPGDPLKIGHDQMKGRKDFHHARAIVIDATGLFNTGALDFPSAFQHSLSLHPDIDYTRQELQISLDIALGSHGFGAAYFRERRAPLALCIIGDPRQRGFGSTTIRQAIFSMIKPYSPEVLTVIEVNAPL